METLWFSLGFIAKYLTLGICMSHFFSNFAAKNKK